MRIELIYFEGCPNVERARANLRTALDAAGLDAPVEEWDRDAPEAPAYARGYPSPTVLVDGRDVSGDAGESDSASCRVLGAPGVDDILAALSAS
ncbi:MAG TPA: glutathione S-transferase N-terminal domain-containing protein [Longimicrobiales bacterium]|nr:glutathione S-transferase N-terminal domain-containing protein [Longimicrobiales bacterium]